MSIRPQAPAPFLSEEVAERLLALPTPPPSPLSPYSSPLPQIPSPPLPIPSPPPNSPNMSARRHREVRLWYYGYIDDLRMRSYILTLDRHDMTEHYLKPESTMVDTGVSIPKLVAADRRRQTVISELLKADYRRQRQLVEALKIVKSLKTQMIELQTQQGPAKDPAEPELPEEASSSS
ncbi:hypothetical protein Tco_1175105 [Tanacetum coccineum]